MRIIIVGDGKVGSALTVQLSREGHDIVAIDNNQSVLRDAQENLDINVVHGNGATERIQRMADVESSDLLIAATGADETNILACIVAKRLGCRRTIARVRNPDYYGMFTHLKEELGLSMMINPEYSTADEIFRLLQFPSFLRRDSFAKGLVEIVEVEVRQGSPLVGARLFELPKKVPVKVLVCAVTRGSQVFIPDGSFLLQDGDRVSFTASSGDLARLIRSLNLAQRRVKDVFIVGGSRIGFYLADKLLAGGCSVKIIERDEEKCQTLAEMLPRANIVHADGSDKSVLDSEGVAAADAVVTLTDIDEENLIISMYANYLGTFKVVTKINRTEYKDALAGKGIDTIVSPKEICCTDMVRYVRALGNRRGETALTLHRIVDDRVEALEFRAVGIPQLGKRLSQVRLRPNTLIACITRRGKMIIPQGSDTIEKDDTVIVVAPSDQMINNLSDVFLE